MTGADGNFERHDERTRAVDRLDAASTERDRVHDERETAHGAAAGVEAAASVRAADEQVAARERWLEWVDQRGD